MPAISSNSSLAQIDQAFCPFVASEERMLLSERFSERMLSHMDAALERACNLVPDIMSAYPARKYVAEKIVFCASHHSQTVERLTAAGRRAVAELALKVVESD